MVKQIKSSEVKAFLAENSGAVLLDVRTENEWTTLGKPELKDLNSKTYFITISPDLTKWQEPDPDFVKTVKKVINKETQVLVMCSAGGRSMIAANLLEKEGFTVHNISDGFSGNDKGPGWKKAILPTNY
jgi:rhodanese-related sulfurtransferase